MIKALNVIAVFAVLGCAVLLGRQWKQAYQPNEEPELGVPLGAQHIGYEAPSGAESSVRFSLMIETPEGEMITEAEYRRRYPEAFAKPTNPTTSDPAEPTATTIEKTPPITDDSSDQQ